MLLVVRKSGGSFAGRVEVSVVRAALAYGFSAWWPAMAAELHTVALGVGGNSGFVADGDDESADVVGAGSAECGLPSEVGGVGELVGGEPAEGVGAQVGGERLPGQCEGLGEACLGGGVFGAVGAAPATVVIRAESSR